MILVGKPQEKMALGRPTYRWEDNIKVECTVIGWEGMAWFN
jgi:hypothetical protein